MDLISSWAIFADIGIGVVEQFLIVGEVLLQFAVLAENVHHGLEIRVGFGQLAVSILIVEKRWDRRVSCSRSRNLRSRLSSLANINDSGCR